MAEEVRRTDRLGVLLDQFDKASELAQVRLAMLGDEEYLWEPVAGCWSIRRREDATTARAYGPGDWVIDSGAPDIPNSEYAQVGREIASGQSLTQVAGNWGVSVARVEEVLAHTGPLEPDTAPFTTIAWRLGHLHGNFAGVWEWTFGERREPKLIVDFTPSATLAVDRFWAALDRWRDGIADVTDEQLDTVGLSQYPYGSDPEEPFISVIWANNIELIHHLAEIALLRDLWRAR
jgi:DinB superfamily